MYDIYHTNKYMLKQDIEFYSPTTLKSYNLDAAITYQLNMLENLDKITKKHCENVANLTCRICDYLHASNSFTVNATVCAYLHDIGKMFIPKEILTKPTRLTDEEFEIMKTHTTIGYNICMKDLKLRPFAGGPLYHHECLNGTRISKWFDTKRYSILCTNHSYCRCF